MKRTIELNITKTSYTHTESHWINLPFALRKLSGSLWRKLTLTGWRYLQEEKGVSVWQLPELVFLFCERRKVFVFFFFFREEEVPCFVRRPLLSYLSGSSSLFLCSFSPVSGQWIALLSSGSDKESTMHPESSIFCILSVVSSQELTKCFWTTSWPASSPQSMSSILLRCLMYKVDKMRTSSLDNLVPSGMLGIRDCSWRNPSLSSLTRVLSRAAFLATQTTSPSFTLIAFDDEDSLQDLEDDDVFSPVLLAVLRLVAILNSFLIMIR